MKEVEKLKLSKELENLPKEKWFFFACYLNHDLVECINKLTDLIDGGNNDGWNYTDSKDHIGCKEIVGLIMQHLYQKKYYDTLSALEIESGVRFLFWDIKEVSPLRSLLAISMENIEEHFDGNKLKEKTISTPDEEEKIPETMLYSEIVEQYDPFNDEEEDFKDEPFYPLKNDSEKYIHMAGDKINSASVNKMLEILVSDKQKLKYSEIFLLTHHAFISSGRLLYKLIEIYNLPNSYNEVFENESTEPMEKNEDTSEDFKNKKLTKFTAMTKLRTVSVIKKWIQKNWSDFNPKILSSLKNFIVDVIYKENLQHYKLLENAIKIMENGVTVHKTTPVTMVEPIVSYTIFTQEYNFMMFNEEELARQITIMDFNIFSKILPVELMKLAWSKQRYMHRAVNVLKFIEIFNRTSSWVATELLLHKKVKKRGLVLQKFIKLLSHLRAMKNLNSVVAVISGLETAAVHRLSFTWAEIPQRLSEIYTKIKDEVSSKKSYKNLRETLLNSDPPCIPYFGVYLTDLTFIEDGNPDYLQNGLVNFSKMTLLHSVIEAIKVYQNISYNFYPVSQITNWLINYKLIDSDTLYNKSLQIEPRDTKRKDIS